METTIRVVYHLSETVHTLCTKSTDPDWLGETDSPDQDAEFQIMCAC